MPLADAPGPSVLAPDAFLRSGKVRDLYELPDGRMLLVASDRISAFDVVLPTEIPDKGRVLTGISRFWFAETAGIAPNHLLDTDPSLVREGYVAEFTDRAASGDAEAASALPRIGSFDDWQGRLMICQPAWVVPIEAVVRGYLAGSGWKEYQVSGTVCGVRLPDGLQEGDRLPEPIFTPATKAEAGEHDQNIDFDSMVKHVATSWGVPVDLAGQIAEAIRDRALALYRYGAAVAARQGILVADTKFEFGLPTPTERDREPVGAPEDRIIDRTARPGSHYPDTDSRMTPDRLMLIDEVLTPDSSRFWDASTYEPGRAQASFDKQYVRDWLETQDWDKTAPGPALPADIVAGTRDRYIQAYERITGARFERYLEEDVVAR
jgi:phosphoribosylaminoimidazole-succinocarboxamide synthase